MNDFPDTRYLNEPMASVTKYEWLCFQLFLRQLADVPDPSPKTVKDAIEEAEIMAGTFWEAMEKSKRAFDTPI